MNAILFEYDIFDTFIGEPPKLTGFRTFCESIDILDYIFDPEIYLEARMDHPKGSAVAGALKNTVDTTRGVAQVYGDITDGGGSFLKGIADLTVAACQLAAKIIKFVFENLGKIPAMLTKIIKQLQNIPEGVKAKIKGNIQLYIASADLERFYVETFPQISNFISTASEMSKGDTWTTFIDNIKDAARDPKKITDLPGNDMKSYKKLKSIYSSISKIEFRHSAVELNKGGAIDTYFGGAESINFRDLNGKTHKSTYHDALITLCKDLESKKEPLNDIYNLITTKFTKTQANNSLAKLNVHQQRYIKDSIQMVSKVLAIVGNLIRYVLVDINTIQKSCAKILEKRGISIVKKDVKPKEKNKTDSSNNGE